MSQETMDAMAARWLAMHFGYWFKQSHLLSIRRALAWRARPARWPFLVLRPGLRNIRNRWQPPFGWMWDRSDGGIYLPCAGPMWLLGPRALWRAAVREFFEWAIRSGVAHEPYEGCRFHELEWFSSQRWRA